MSQLSAKVPVGFRFHPTDEELVGYYLPKKVGAMKIDLDLIRDLDLYKLEPWDLQELCKIQADSNEKQTDYYFFSRKDKKYPTGNRANRATTKGFWKATGRDKPIHTKLQLHTQQLIGMRKTLVFYQGRAPHGVKTDWIMHEFRLDDGPGRPAHEDGGWVVCRVFKKNKNLKLKLQERALSYEEQMGILPDPIGSPDILSGSPADRRFSFPNHTIKFQQQQAPLGNIKREFINLDEYNSPSSDLHGHGHQYLNNYATVFGATPKMEPSSEQMRSYLTRSFSLKRPELVDVHGQLIWTDVDQVDDGTTTLGDFNDVTTTSGTASDGETTYNDVDSAISGALENVDWSSLLQEPTTTTGGASTKTADGDVTVLLQLKRQNSDIFSSLDLWNYSQIAQHM